MARKNQGMLANTIKKSRDINEFLIRVNVRQVNLC
jgi:hypothetical protein